MFIEAIGIAARLLVAPLSPSVDLHLPQASHMTLGASVPAPIGYISFCRRRPDQCGLTEGRDPRMQPRLALIEPASLTDLKPNAFTPSGDASSARSSFPAPAGLSAALSGAAVADGSGGALIIHITAQSWSALNGVNEAINGKLRPMSDEQAFGASNYWTLPLEDEHRAVGNCKHYALEKRKALVDAGLSPDALSLAIVRTGAGELHAVLVVATDHGELVLDNLTGRIKGWKDSRYRWLARQTPGHPLAWVSVAEPS